MPKGAHALLLLAAIIASVSNHAALKLPYEVLDTIVGELSDLDDFKDVNTVNVSDERGPTRPIYRLDLDPNYVAYYEIDTGNNYVVLSAGPNTGDYREVESGPVPRPTDVLAQQAHGNGQQCEKFFRLSPMGLSVCQNQNGTVVAATYNWTAGVPEIDNWRLLDNMAKGDLQGFQSLWMERATERRTMVDWATTDHFREREKLHLAKTNGEALFPGSEVKVALGEDFESVDVYITNYGERSNRTFSKSKWQEKLCKVLVEVCLNGSTKVNPSAFRKMPNNLLYLRLEIHGNRKFVKKVLEGRELRFVIRIKTHRGEVIMKHYAINLSSKRYRRIPAGSGNREVPGEDSDMPDYDQHICCGGCYSGCSPVAWAQVFGYYDRRGSNPGSIFSSRIYGTTTEVAPLSMTPGVERFVEDIRKKIKTRCDGEQGATSSENMDKIEGWFQARQGRKARVRRYKDQTPYSYRRKGRSWIDSGYPVIFEFLIDGKRDQGHAVVASKYRIKYQRYLHCECVNYCEWQQEAYYEFYLHYGWGGSSNKWQELNPYGLFVAYVSK
ncbi:uncharacterized protein [Montipora foliosa]|uniref:uncharacterized protein n=1 Tax=Montipora foliosa TaxID=591990 RepID=UPI0035F10874